MSEVRAHVARATDEEYAEYWREWNERQTEASTATLRITEIPRTRWWNFKRCRKEREFAARVKKAITDPIPDEFHFMLPSPE